MAAWIFLKVFFRGAEYLLLLRKNRGRFIYSFEN